MTSHNAKNKLNETPLLQHIAEMPLQVMINRLQHLGSDTDFLETSISPLDNDSVAFEIGIRRKGVLTALLHGTMQSWADGAMTSVRCYDTEISKKRINYTQLLLIVLIMIAIGFTAVQLFNLPVIPIVFLSIVILLAFRYVYDTERDDLERRNADGFLHDPTAIYINPMERLSADKEMLLAIIRKFVASEESDISAHQDSDNLKRKSKNQ